MHLSGGYMPTAKPRITITLTDQQHALLSSLSDLQKVSMSSIVVDLLEATVPVLERLTAVLHNAANAPQAVLDQLKRSAQTAEDDVSGLQGSMLKQLDLLVEESVGTVPGATRSGARGAKPPTSNRGVRITSPQPKIAPISPMKKGEKNGRAHK
jgi:hypothetical protein